MENEEFYGALDRPGEIDRLIDRGERIKSEGARRTSIVHYAADNCSADVVLKLLDAGGNAFLNEFDDLGMTPLAYAAKRGDSALVLALFEAGSKLNIWDENGFGESLIARVIQWDGSAQIVRLLLSKGADPRLGDPRNAVDVAQDRAESKGDAESCDILRLVRSAADYLSLLEDRK